ncbi:hypothetical protein E2C01_067869 [Portunus trituberculatus]|uniref:Uncharacterized protein n=1 Tax=Portunus trituberculatus TaxID=210409 RepID=A0A5B7HV03_PORTR|nr:hypothetical protein [Portunus trituberculatus]
MTQGNIPLRREISIRCLEISRLSMNKRNTPEKPTNHLISRDETAKRFRKMLF